MFSRSTKIRLILLFVTTMLIASITAMPVLSDESWMVTGQQGDNFEINAGLSAGLEPGVELYVRRATMPIARVKVLEVGQYKTLVSISYIEPNEAVKIGDVVSRTSFEPGASVEVKERMEPKKAPPGKDTSNLTPEQSFAKNLSANTRTTEFRVSGAGKASVSLMDVANILTALTSIGGVTGSGQFYVNPWLATDIALETYGSVKYSGDQSKKTATQVVAVLWDKDLMNSFCDMYAYKENMTDPAQTANMRQMMYEDKGLEYYHVFEIKVVNNGPQPIQLAPFKWHVYLLDNKGNKVKCEKYDETLDKTLNPRAQTTGNVYFPKRDAQGIEILEPSDKITLEFENIGGRNGNITWESDRKL
ncbi:MAG: hypothetical protein M1269_12075 [Chloroflexi bacterium]|nr:hypothetical protein [Chloroflexota bacterium]